MILAWPDNICYHALTAVENSLYVSKEKKTLRSPNIGLDALASKIIFQNQWVIKRGHIPPPTQKLVTLFLAKFYQIIKKKHFILHSASLHGICNPTGNIETISEIPSYRGLQFRVMKLGSFLLIPSHFLSDNAKGKLSLYFQRWGLWQDRKIKVASKYFHF